MAHRTSAPPPASPSPLGKGTVPCQSVPMDAEYGNQEKINWQLSPWLLSHIVLENRKYGKCWAGKFSSYTKCHPRVCKILCMKKLWMLLEHYLMRWKRMLYLTESSKVNKAGLSLGSQGHYQKGRENCSKEWIFASERNTSRMLNNRLSIKMFNFSQSLFFFYEWKL